MQAGHRNVRKIGKCRSQHANTTVPINRENGYNMMTSSSGSIFRVTGHLCGEFTGPGEFPTQRPVTRSFGVFSYLRLNKRLSKQSWDWWFDTPSRPLWRHRNGYYNDCVDLIVGKSATGNWSNVLKVIEKLSKSRDDYVSPSNDDFYRYLKDTADIQPDMNFKFAILPKKLSHFIFYIIMIRQRIWHQNFRIPAPHERRESYKQWFSNWANICLDFRESTKIKQLVSGDSFWV